MAGWQPRGRDNKPADEAPSPASPRRRRKKPVVEEEEFPNTARATAKASPRNNTRDLVPRSGHVRRHSDEPRTAMKINLGDRWSRIVRDVKAGEYTWAEFCETLDEEELARGQLRSEDGGFMGRPPTFVPREFLLACQREQKRKFEEIFGSEVLGIAQEYVKLCRDKEIPPKERAKLMQYAMERIFGGIPKEFRVQSEQPWEMMLVNVTADEKEDMPEHLRRRYEGYAERRGDGGSD